MLVVCAVSVGAKGSGFGHGLPCGPLVISKWLWEGTASLPDHGVKDASVV
jgi:hypothetical protein